jgi:hypothetical protein
VTHARSAPRLALTKAEAAASLSISVDSFERHVLEHLRVVYVGARRLIPVAELERWVREQAIPVLPPVTVTVEQPKSPANGRVRASRGPVGGAS